jgi:hypothetical protein
VIRRAEKTVSVVVVGGTGEKGSGFKVQGVGLRFTYPFTLWKTVQI